MKSNVDSRYLQLLTVKQAAHRLSCSAANVYALIDSGKLPVIQVGRSKGYRIDIRDLEAFTQKRKFYFQATQSIESKTNLKHINI